MANTYTAIATVTVGSGGSSSIDFTSIPATYTDLLLSLSLRSNRSTGDSAVRLTFNTTGGTYTNRRLYGDGSAVGSDSQSGGGLAYANIPAVNSTANTFGSIQVYIPNYGSSNGKAYSADVVEENNSSSTYVQNMLFASLWSGTGAITSISLTDWNSASFVQYSTATLYGIKNS